LGYWRTYKKDFWYECRSGKILRLGRRLRIYPLVRIISFGNAPDGWQLEKARSPKFRLRNLDRLCRLQLGVNPGVTARQWSLVSSARPAAGIDPVDPKVTADNLCERTRLRHLPGARAAWAGSDRDRERADLHDNTTTVKAIRVARRFQLEPTNDTQISFRTDRASRS
jgi:hypothetical protein